MGWWLLALNERYPPPRKPWTLFIFFYHLESICWKLALSRIHGFNSATSKSCAIPERTKKKYHFAVEKRKRGKAKVVPKSVGNEASGSAPSNLPPTTPLLDNRISVRYIYNVYCSSSFKWILPNQKQYYISTFNCNPIFIRVPAFFQGWSTSRRRVKCDSIRD